MILGMENFYPDLAERLMNAALSFGSASILHPPTSYQSPLAPMPATTRDPATGRGREHD
jgi:hypothetical protein